jgi:predicted MFS family arabinose efflux permease
VDSQVNRGFVGVEGRSDAASRYALGILFAVALLNYVDRSLISVLQVPIKRELGLSDAQLGALTGLVFATFYAVAAVPLGALVDRLRRTWLMAAAVTVWTTMTALSSVATGFTMLLWLRIGVALGEAVSVPATHSLFSDFFARGRRGSAFASWALAPPLGVMIGLASGGWLSGSLGWRSSFLIVGLTGFAVIPFLLAVREPQRGRYDVGARATAIPVREAAGVLWRMRSFRLLVAAATLHSFSQQALLNWVPPFYARVHGLPLKTVATWAGLMVGVGGGIGAVLGGLLLDRLVRRDRRWFAWSQAVACLAFVPLALFQIFSPTAPVSIAVGFAAMGCATFYVAPANVTAQTLVPPRMRGVTSGVLLLIPTVFGVGLGPFLTGAMSDVFAARPGFEHTSLRFALALALVGSALAGVAFLRLAAALPADLPPLATSLPDTSDET